MKIKEDNLKKEETLTKLDKEISISQLQIDNKELILNNLKGIYKNLNEENEHKNKIKNEFEKIKVDKEDLPDDWKDENVIDFINKLLERKKKNRLGYNTDTEVKEHPWFKDIPWEQIENMTYDSPFVFDTEDNFDESYAQMVENDSIYDGNKD